MTTYSQADQPMRVETVLDEDVLLLEGLRGEEAVSEPFLFTLDLLSEDPEIDGEEILRSEMRVELGLAGGEVRSVHGVVRRFLQVGWVQDLVHYRVEIVPWIWFLSLGRDSRIFQEMDVLEIVEEVFGEAGYSAFDLRCTRSYEPREFTVQYRESDLAFVSRLLEDEGIFYFFEHSESGHTLVLADDMSAFKPCEGQPEARVHARATPEEDVVTELVREHAVHAGQVTLSDYDYLQPSMTLRSTVSGDEPEEVYDYPGRFDDLDAGDRRARLALERQEARRQTVRGSGTCRAFVSGTRFDLLDHLWRDANRSWALLEVRHRAKNAAYRAQDRDEGFDYRNEFVAIPHAVPYRPPRRTPKPVVQGAQTAQVVGPSGEKIWVDKHGRVKVHFHWDRLGSRDDKSSCWVRVSQNWAGKQWGGIFVPHIGQEVIVDFLEGDPDRPIITGRVYNAENPPPQELPSNQHKSIIEDDFGNEMVFDATPGDEHIRIYSPSHNSAVQIGKSVKVFSDSDFCEIMNGKKGLFTKGTQVGGFVGFKGDVELGGTLKVFAGTKTELSMSTSVSVSTGPSAKYSSGGEYRWNKDDFRQHSKGRSVLKSDEEVLVVGGGSGSTGLVEANSSGLTMQFAPNKKAFEVTSEAVRASMIAGLAVESLTAALVGAAFWERNRNSIIADIGFSALSGVLPAATSAAAQITDQLSKEPDELTRSAIHDDPKGRIKIHEDGVMIHALSGSQPNVAVALNNKSGGVLAAMGEKAVQIVAEKGDMDLTAKKKVNISGKGGVDVTGSGPVTIKGSQIKLG